MSINDFSIGVDIELIKRFRGLNRKKSRNFLTKIFTDKEMNYCFSKKAPAQHLAVRFVAKEAIVKAINSLSKKVPSLNEIEIVNNTNGVPVATAKGYNVKISLSHCNDKAIAFCFVVKK
ncbi:MAG: holo-ACP synthase [Candidatus Staskawiczbacteria bacterium]|jgi:holo-[acyl-carrier protein] synthase